VLGVVGTPLETKPLFGLGVDGVVGTPLEIKALFGRGVEGVVGTPLANDIA
jgi:hypothetical protein